MDDALRELERRVLSGDASALLALRKAYQRAGQVQEDEPKRSNGLKLVPLPPATAASAYRTPLYDVVAVPPTPVESEVLGWVFHWGAGAYDPVLGRAKSLADTSADASWNDILPPRSVFFWSGLSVVPDSGSLFSDVEALWNDCALEFWSSSTNTSHRWPLRYVMQAPATMSTSEDGVLQLAGAMAAHARSVRVPGRRRVVRQGGVREIRGRFPFEIAPQCNTRLRLIGKLRQPVSRVTRLMVILHGVRLSPCE